MASQCGTKDLLFFPVIAGISNDEAVELRKLTLKQRPMKKEVGFRGLGFGVDFRRFLGQSWPVCHHGHVSWIPFEASQNEVANRKSTREGRLHPVHPKVLTMNHVDAEDRQSYLY